VRRVQVVPHAIQDDPRESTCKTVSPGAVDAHVFLPKKARSSRQLATSPSVTSTMSSHSPQNFKKNERTTPLIHGPRQPVLLLPKIHRSNYKGSIKLTTVLPKLPSLLSNDATHVNFKNTTQGSRQNSTAVSSLKTPHAKTPTSLRQSPRVSLTSRTPP
jgi:hypothetical protein